MRHKENRLSDVIARIPDFQQYGLVKKVSGLLIECEGIAYATSIGSRCKIINKWDEPILCEVIGLDDQITLLMPFSSTDGISVGNRVFVDKEYPSVFPDESWKGRIINALGQPIDGKGPLIEGRLPYRLRNSPPPAHERLPVRGKIDLGVRAINTFLTCCRGQRLGIFAGSGVGKSMLVSLLTKYSDADVRVIGLIGERGRELYEFIHEYLGEEGLKSAIIVAATSDESALMRKQAAYMTMAIAEYFRDQDKNVLCLMDSVTRFAMAQREIGLSAGEPPTTKGYTPTVFVELPKLLERAGPGISKGYITGLFTVLVEGDDHNEPISDAVRGILDGHIVLDRTIGERGRYPAINILRSVSRTMPNCNNDEENDCVNRARNYMSTYNDMAELIRLGAYKKGSDAQVDQAIFYHDALEQFLSQKPNEQSTLAEGYSLLKDILNKKEG